MKKKKVMNQIIINIVNHIKNKQINNVMKKITWSFSKRLLSKNIMNCFLLLLLLFIVANVEHRGTETEKVGGVRL